MTGSDFDPRRADLELEELLAEAGPAEPRIRTLLAEMTLSLLEARLVIDAERWQREGGKDRFVREYLAEALGGAPPAWDDEQLLGTHALDAVRAVNARAHAYGATTGAARYRARVIEVQGGEFCSMCGAREELVVDHIVPVSVGGVADSVPNMQLLCVSCNAGKSNLRDRLLPAVLRHNTGRGITPGVRFKHLLMDSAKVGGRDRGVCECGTRAGEVQLRVTVWPPAAAANFLNLRTCCESCTSEG